MSLHLEILVPDGVVLEQDVTSVQAADASGRFGLRPGHEQFVTVLAPGILSYRDRQGREAYAAVDGGVLLLERDQISVVTRDAVLADRLDEVADVAAAMLAARRTEERTAWIAAEQLAIALLREVRRSEQQP